MLMMPSQVNRWPWRALRLGITLIEQVNTAVDALDDVARGADAHQVANLVFGANGSTAEITSLQDLGRLAHRQTSDGVAVQIILSNLLHMLDAQILKRAALVDAEQQLIRVDGLFPRARRFISSLQRSASVPCGHWLFLAYS